MGGYSEYYIGEFPFMEYGDEGFFLYMFTHDCGEKTEAVKSF
jgi:hypothetical protein